jgi:hypothetical protein
LRFGDLFLLPAVAEADAEAVVAVAAAEELEEGDGMELFLKLFGNGAEIDGERWEFALLVN